MEFENCIKTTTTTIKRNQTHVYTQIQYYMYRVWCFGYIHIYIFTREFKFEKKITEDTQRI